MWKILGLVALCGLLGPSEGKPHAHWACTSGSKFGEVLIRGIDRDEFLLSRFKEVSISDVSFGDLLGVLNTITGLKVLDFSIDSFDHQLEPLTSCGILSFPCTFKIQGLIEPSSSVVNIVLKAASIIRYEFASDANNCFKLIVRQCGVTFNNIDVSILNINPSPSAVTTIFSSIVASLSLHFCNTMASGFNVAAAYFLNSFNAQYPFGTVGTLVTSPASAPSVNNDGVVVPLFNDLQTTDGGIVSIPDSAGNLNVVPLNANSHVVSIHKGLFDVVLAAACPDDPVEVRCTPDEFTGADGLKTAFLNLVSSEVGAIIGAGTLYAKIIVIVKPQTDFGSSSITASVSAKIDFSVKNLDESTTDIVSTQASITLALVVTPTNGVLSVSTSISGLQLTLLGSNVGIRDVYTLEPHCSNLVRDKCLTHLNDKLSGGFPIPKPWHIDMNNARLETFETHPVACI